MQRIKQGETTASHRAIPFTTVNAINWDQRLDATTLSLAVQLQLPDGTFVTESAQSGINGTNVTQPNLGSHAAWQGVCLYTPATANLTQVGVYTVLITAPGMEQRELTFQVTPQDPYAAEVLNQQLDVSPVDGVTVVSLAQALKVLVSHLAHKGTLPPGAGSFNTRDAADTKNRLAGSVDSSGNRIITTFDGT